jgi:hypothetical protein
VCDPQLGQRGEQHVARSSSLNCTKGGHHLRVTDSRPNGRSGAVETLG